MCNILPEIKGNFHISPPLFHIILYLRWCQLHFLTMAVSVLKPTDINSFLVLEYTYMFALYAHSNVLLSTHHRRHNPACQRPTAHPSQVLCVRASTLSCPWLHALSLRRRAEDPPPTPSSRQPNPQPQGHSAGCLPAWRAAERRREKIMSRYFCRSALWSSHRLLKQSPPINIYGLSDGSGSIDRGGKRRRSVCE